MNIRWGVYIQLNEGGVGANKRENEAAQCAHQQHSSTGVESGIWGQKKKGRF